jgi:dTDP-4-amino-4,6-dideoxygalactose transaminase
MQDVFNAKHVFLTTSCTHAMELALMALDIQPGDEIILPSFTFTTTATAVVLQHAVPVYAEIELDTLNIDPVDVESKITSRTRAIMVMHYNGVACKMAEIMQLAERHGLAVIEDAAHAVGAKYQGRYLGTWGDAGCYSFHSTKNFTCGEGGALLSNNDDLCRRAEILREKGTNRSAFLRGEVDKYTWVDKGSSYVLSDLLAALLEVQLRRLDEIKSARKELYRRYAQEFRALELQDRIHLPVIPEDCDPSYHLFLFRTHTGEERNALLDGLRQRGIQATFHYVPLHSSPFGSRYCREELPLTQLASETLIRLPLYPGLAVADQDRVITEVRRILG